MCTEKQHESEMEADLFLILLQKKIINSFINQFLIALIYG